MNLENEITILRGDLKLAREREDAMAARLVEMEREMRLLRSEVQSRLAGENEPDSINARLRRLQSDVGVAEAGGADLEGGGGAGGTLSEQVAGIAAQVTEILEALCAGGTVTAECREDGTGMDGTVTFDGLTCP